MGSEIGHQMFLRLASPIDVTIRDVTWRRLRVRGLFIRVCFDCVESALGADPRLLAVLGPPGGSGSAHVMQFGPVGVERDRDEFAPSRANSVKPSALMILLFGPVGG